jgi:hypothetical protein
MENIKNIKIENVFYPNSSKIKSGDTDFKNKILGYKVLQVTEK